MASMIRSEMALWPHPAHSVDFPPRYSTTGSPIVFLFGPGAPLAVVAVATLEALPDCKFFGDAAGVDGQPAIVQNAAQFHHLFSGKIELEQRGELGVAVLLHHVNAL